MFGVHRLVVLISIINKILILIIYYLIQSDIVVKKSNTAQFNSIVFLNNSSN